MSVVNDFYMVEFDHEGETLITDFWEKAFAEIEGVASTALMHVVDERRWPPAAADREALATWMALQRLRTTAIRDQQSELRSTMYKMIVGVNGIAKLRQMMESHLRRSVDDVELEAEWDDLVQPGGTHVRGNVIDHIETIRRLIDPATEQFVESGMSVWRFDRKRLITSDSPVTLIGTPPPWGGGIGLATADFVALPLSRFTALAIGKPGDRDSEFAGTTAIAKAFNGAVSSEARNWIVTHPDDEPGSLYLQMNEPRPREMDPPDLTDFIYRDRPLETTIDERGPEYQAKPNSIPLVYPGWPLLGRDFVNPHSPLSE